MKYFFKVVRMILQPIILLIDWITRPAWPKRSQQEQEELDNRTANLALYQFYACPFCIITRRTMRRLGLNIELRDAQNDPQWSRELVEQGGKHQVPCLRISSEDGQVEWLYESKDIQRYLEQQYGDTA
jgi:glutaredoxin